MHSLFSYRFDRWMHEKSPHVPGQMNLCKLLTVRLFVNDLAQEKAFYTGVLAVTPLAEDEQSVTLPLAEGIALVLASAGRGTNEGLLGRVELELETSDLRPLWQSARAAALSKVSELLVANGALAFNALSPTNLWLNLNQKSAEE
jgi:catechol 2,3-dioxygenase-like lactoylglutathione lyase family enzyme